MLVEEGLIGFALFAVILAIATYHLVERPIRVGRHRRGLKAIALFVILSQQASALPSWFPLLGEDRFELRTELQTAQAVKGHIAFGETHVFVGPRYLLTVRHGASLSYTPARERCERNPELMKFGPSYGLYAVLRLQHAAQQFPPAR